MTELPLASVSSVLSVTVRPDAPAWSTVAAHEPSPRFSVAASVHVSPPSYEYDSFAPVSAPGS